MKSPLVVLCDVDNTLLNDNRIVSDLCDFLLDKLGEQGAKQYWTHFEALSQSLGYADYLGALQRARDEHPHEMHFIAITNFLLTYPFSERLFPRALDVIDHVACWALPVIVSDGDVVLQPIKLHRAGLARKVQDRVLVYIHKEKELDDIMQRYPATHYVFVEDNLSILSSVKREWGQRVTTIHIRPHGHPPDEGRTALQPDITLNDIGDMLRINEADLRGSSHATSTL